MDCSSACFVNKLVLRSSFGSGCYFSCPALSLLLFDSLRWCFVLRLCC